MYKAYAAFIVDRLHRFLDRTNEADMPTAFKQEIIKYLNLWCHGTLPSNQKEDPPPPKKQPKITTPKPVDSEGITPSEVRQDLKCHQILFNGFRKKGWLVPLPGKKKRYDRTIYEANRDHMLDKVAANEARKNKKKMNDILHGNLAVRPDPPKSEETKDHE